MHLRHQFLKWSAKSRHSRRVKKQKPRRAGTDERLCAALDSPPTHGLSHLDPRALRIRGSGKNPKFLWLGAAREKGISRSAGDLGANQIGRRLKGLGEAV